MFTCIFDNKTWLSDPLNHSVEFWHNYNPEELSEMGYWVAIFAIFLAIGIWLMSNKRSKRLFESISNNLLVVSSVIWLLGVLVYIVGFYKGSLNWISVIPRAVVSSFRMFVVANELARVDPDLQKDAIYMTAFSIVHFTAAFITFMFIFKMVGYKIKSYFRIVMHKLYYAGDKTVHLFGGINEASCLLAEDIRKNCAKDTIIFVDIDKESDDNAQKKATLGYITNIITIKNSEIARLDNIDALVDHCYNWPAAVKGVDSTDVFGSLHLKNIGDIVQQSKESYFYFLSEDEAQNITGALNLQKDKTICSMGNKKPVMYVHARRDANNEVFDHYSQYDEENKRCKIKIIDSAYLSIATLKQNEEALPVNCVKVDTSSGLVDSAFTALIVGFGGTGQEAFKFLYEYSAFVGKDMKRSPFKCYAIDAKMNRIEGLIRAKMPDIGEDELCLVQAAVDSEEFWVRIDSIISDLNYVVLTLNDDNLGLSLAVNIFKQALIKRSSNSPMLRIMLRCYDSGMEKRMEEVICNLNMSIEGNNIKIELFGKSEVLYCCDVILSDKIVRDAKEFNKVYENSNLSVDEQWQLNFGETEIKRLMTEKGMTRYHAIYDINRRIAQNVSNSLHCTTKLKLMGLDKSVSLDRLKLYRDYVESRKQGTTVYDCPEKDAQLLINLARVEHERWIASHKLMGYTFSPENDCRKKHHKCMCAWEKLDEQTQSYDCNVVDTTIKQEIMID